MPYFQSPKILFGKGMLKRLGAEIEGKGNKAVIITDKNVAALCTPVSDALKTAGYDVKIWDGSEQEPSVEVARAAGNFLIDNEPQLIIGFGGGSAMDTAKAAWIMYERPDLTATGFDNINPRTRLNLRKKARLITIPTTSGTGSDVTWAIVLTDTAAHRKIAFANNDVVPDIAMLIPEITVGLPKALTAGTGMDVLGHALDGYTARQQTDFSDGPCLHAMKLTFDWLPKAFKDGSDLTAREKMQNAATIAGLGFGNSNTSICHAVAHSVGTTFSIPHGRAVGIALIHTMNFLASNPVIAGAPDPVERLAAAARYAGIDAISRADAINKLMLKIRMLQKEIGEPSNLKEAGITQKQFDEKLELIATLSAKDVNMFSSPCECKDDKLKQLIRDMFDK